MYTKLNKPIHIPTYKIGQHRVGYGNRITYSSVLTPLNDIFSLVPQRYQKDFGLMVMEISGKIPPHTDSGILSTINIYIKTDNCKTIFYELNGTTVYTTQIRNQTNGMLFDLSSLKVVGEFEAEPNDAWLLDVTQIHSVTSAANTMYRVAICLQSSIHSVSQVKEMLAETGYI